MSSYEIPLPQSEIQVCTLLLFADLILRQLSLFSRFPRRWILWRNVIFTQRNNYILRIVTVTTRGGRHLCFAVHSSTRPRSCAPNQYPIRCSFLLRRIADGYRKFIICLCANQISCQLQWLENLPICLGFVLEKGEAVVTRSPYTTGQLQDLTDCSKEPEVRVFSDFCLVICNSRATSQCLTCSRLYSLNRWHQKLIANRQVIPLKCSK